jgi:cbb3-type cytochrome oxidase subunit 3
MWNSWAIYVCIVLLIILVVGIMWTYRKDKRDALNYSELIGEKDKLQLGVYLDPIVHIRKE